MKYLKHFLFIIIAAPLVWACTKDDNDRVEKGDTADKAVNEWVYTYMASNYLWRDQITTSPKYEWEYDAFFKSLLSWEDGKSHRLNEDGDDEGYFYSSIRKYVNSNDDKKTRAETDYETSTFGFDYIITQSFLVDEKISEDEDNRYAKKYVTIVWVTPDSPADKAELKRGDHIYKIDGSELPQEGYRTLLAKLSPPVTGSSTVSLTKCKLELLRYTDAVDDNGKVNKNVPVVKRSDNKDDIKTVSLTSKFMRESPIYQSDLISETYTDGKKVGYMVYNEFERGYNGTYDDALKDAFSYLKSRGIQELILDLRYNPGGYVSSCQLLASLIVPKSKQGDTFQIMSYVERDSTIHYITQENTVGLNKVYIMASGYSASASEALMHCLEGSGITVHHIGSTTEGKNVGQTVKDTQFEITGGNRRIAMGGYDYLVSAITFRIKDAHNNTYPETGIDPEQNGGYLVNEEFVVDFKELGNPQEPMLAAALYHIINGRWPAETRSAESRSGSMRRLGKGIPRNVKPSKGYIADI